MSVEDATLDQIVAHLKILRLAGLSDVRRGSAEPFEESVEESRNAVPEAASLENRNPERPATSERAKVEAAPAPMQTERAPASNPSPAPIELPLADPAESWSAPLPGGERIAALAQLAESVAGCVKCGELARTRRQTVFGVGNPAPRLVLLGEAPGEEEDKRGEPFVGRAGQLLDKMIAACTMRRDEVYILNILKCRPPGNRNPLPAEASACRPFLDRQLEILQPEFVLCLGAVAAKNLLGLDLSVGKMRGKIYRYRGAKVVVTYHPSYLLRQESAKRDAWEDLKFLLREMGIDPAKRRNEA